MSANAGAPPAPAHPLARVLGVAECALTDAVAGRIPAGSADAPWETRVEAVVWLHRASPAAAAALPAALRGARTLPITVGAFVRYLDTPVGPYSEVLASPLVLARAPLPASHVPFIAVDSLPSLHGGRANWELPKTLAAFAWTEEPGGLAAGRAFAVRGDGVESPAPWSVSARVAPRRRGIPLRLPLRDVQVTPEGRELDIPIALAGAARLATVEVESAGPTLPGWLRPGRHGGAVLPAARMRFGAPR